MKNLITIFLNALVVVLHGQDEQVFTVAAKHTVTIIPDIDTLLNDRQYLFTIKNNPLDMVVKASFSAGTVAITDSGLLLKTFKTTSPGRKYVLQLFTYKNQSFKEVGRKEFVIVGLAAMPVSDRQGAATAFPPAVWWYRGIPLRTNDTATVAALQSSGGNISAGDLSTGPPNASSFKMIFECDGKKEEFTNKGTNYSGNTAIASRVWNIKPGCIITLTDVKYRSNPSTPDERLLGPYRIVVTR